MKAWEVIQDPANWCRHNTALDADGVPPIGGATDKAAVQWCAIGAVYKAYEGRDLDAPLLALARRVRSIPGSRYIYEWNDSHTHAEVLSVLKELDI